MGQYKLFVVGNLVFGVLLIALAQVILPICRPMGGVAMRCGHSAAVETALGFALLLIAVVGAGILKRKVYLVLSALATVVGVFVSLVPTVIVGTCPHAHMACHSVTAPVFALSGVVIALSSALNLAYLKLRRRNEQDGL